MGERRRGARAFQMIGQLISDRWLLVGDGPNLSDEWGQGQRDEKKRRQQAHRENECDPESTAHAVRFETIDDRVQRAGEQQRRDHDEQNRQEPDRVEMTRNGCSKLAARAHEWNRPRSRRCKMAWKGLVLGLSLFAGLAAWT